MEELKLVLREHTEPMEQIAPGLYNPTRGAKLGAVPLAILCMSCADCTPTPKTVKSGVDVRFVEPCTDRWVEGELTGESIAAGFPLVTYQKRTYLLSSSVTHTWGWQCFQLYPNGYSDPRLLGKPEEPSTL